MQPMASMALRAARRAGQIIVRALDRVDTLDIQEKQKNDLVSDVDRAAEAAIVEILSKSYPDHAFLCEESGLIGSADAEYTWIIDPLDGTTNFLHGIPHFGVSIACRVRGRIEHAVVLDPLRDESFVASRGQGAQLNDKRMRVTRRQHLESALVGSGIPPGEVDRHLTPYMAMFETVTRRCRSMRRSGSAALDLAYVAAGRLDAFFEPGLKPWDMAAGALLISEAGGLVADFTGDMHYLTTGNIVAGNPKCFKALLQAIAPHVVTSMRPGQAS
ncbi:MAG: inositol monophosphatase [Gammaproteobacteria bacterium]|nr:MAG: inositol monophosphatase [Gammaproteobacteria bacterium]